MKDLNITRKLDELGRIVLPVEARRNLDLAENDAVALYYDESTQALILKKSVPTCVCCQSAADLRPLPRGKFICAACLSQVN